ncbi:MAG: type III-A CRISPR-associated protein Csm2 [Bacteroidota bacterium]
MNTIASKKPQDFKNHWITKGVDNEFIEFLEGFGYYLVDKLNGKDNRPGRNAMTVSQLRNIFSEAKQIESQIKMISSKGPTEQEKKWEETIKPKVLLLRPKIAYATARALDRNRNSYMKAFGEVAEKALSLASEKMEHYQNFIYLLEGIIAYHKKHGGRDK